MKLSYIISKERYEELITNDLRKEGVAKKSNAVNKIQLLLRLY